MTTIVLRHNRIDLALHPLRDQPGPALLHVHGLGERSPAAVPGHLDAWPGAVWAVDLTGHGSSALAHIGPATVFGRGLGAYVALLVAGGRPELVRGAILADGPGLAGGGPTPGSPAIVEVVPPPPPGGTPDPWALVELGRDVRPPDYAATFARQAATRSGLDTAVAVCGVNRPPWLEAVVAEPGVAELRTAAALELFAAPA